MVEGHFGYRVGCSRLDGAVGWGPQCTLDRGQKPLVITRRQQQVVQNLLVRLALFEDVFGTRKSDESKSKCEETEESEDEGAREGGKKQRKDGREAAATTRTPP